MIINHHGICTAITSISLIAWHITNHLSPSQWMDKNPLQSRDTLCLPSTSMPTWVGWHCRRPSLSALVQGPVAIQLQIHDGTSKPRFQSSRFHKSDIWIKQVLISHLHDIAYSTWYLCNCNCNHDLHRDTPDKMSSCQKKPASSRKSKQRNTPRSTCTIQLTTNGNFSNYTLIKASNSQESNFELSQSRTYIKLSTIRLTITKSVGNTGSDLGWRFLLCFFSVQLRFPCYTTYPCSLMHNKCIWYCEHNPMLQTPYHHQPKACGLVGRQVSYEAKSQNCCLSSIILFNDESKLTPFIAWCKV